MKILSAQQINILDAATFQKKSIRETDLIKQAGQSLAQKITSDFPHTSDFHFFCGNGKNGADGLVCAQSLSQSGKNCSITVVNLSEAANPAFSEILEQLNTDGIDINYINNAAGFPQISEKTFIVDAILGIGVNKAVTGLIAEVINKINSQENSTVLSIDLPSGLPTEGPNYSEVIVHADVTYSFELPKLNLLLADNYKFVGDWRIIPLNLDAEQLSQTDTKYQYLDWNQINKFRASLKRQKFSHKGDYGHVLVIAGSKGKIGAAVLTATSVLRSGAGLVTSYVPSCGYEIIQTAVPEAMVICDENPDIITKVDLDLNQFTTIAVGPGIGQDEQTATALATILEHANSPLVLDADALNLLGSNRSLLGKIPPNSILTPHSKEFDRLVGPSHSSFSRLEKQMNFASRYNQVVVLKGAHSSIALPDGKVFFNSTGNPGMATAGSGDVLTGMIAGLLAQGIESGQAALLGVFMHGLAGDKAKRHIGEIALTAGDIIKGIRI